MRFSLFFFRVIIAVVLLATGQVARGRAREHYPSLLWEITGNGLRQPSYLFGTMHISNKMVFNLNDSFYAAIKSVDAVAIELDPEYWQQEIPRVGKQGERYRYYTSTYYTDFLTERSYTEGDFTDQLKEVLRTEPELNDALLYRNESSIDNFQEDTYLDLYIYQTGKKLGKQTTGVETFVEAQRMMVEAYIDMANDKARKNNNEVSGRYADLGQQLQDAYRRGDLDMLDSLNTLTEQSALFTRKFLYDRNMIQAHSIDSIVKTKSLFAGVGAAHLPGKEGVIALLRAKGYKLRPVYMQNRNAEQKELIDSLSVPVHFRRQFAVDSFYSVSVPGKLNDIDNNDDFSKVHYADMGNGAYYLVSRVKTNILFNGYEAQKQLHLVDSLLYENIPGKILAKKEIKKDGYSGLDILNRTRKGDVQRYQIYVTPAELLIFKMGGKGKYVYGPESDSFFNSIVMRKQVATAAWSLFYPPSGGFTVRLPDVPRSFYALKGPDNLPVWKYETVDPSTGNVYGVFKKSIYSFDFIEQDTFDLSLVEESFCNAAFVDKKLSRTLSAYKGRPVVDVTLLARTGDYVKARFLLQGPHYYMLAVRTKDKSFNPAPFFNSFDITAYQYPQAVTYADTNLKFQVQTPVFPAMDKDIMDMLMYVKKNDPGQKAGAEAWMPEHSHANFISETTGEVVAVNSYVYPRYFYVRDSALFYRNLLVPDSTLIIAKKEYLSRGDTAKGVLLYLCDTGSTRMIKKLMLVQGHHILTLATVVDSALPESAFISTFYKTFSMQRGKPSPSLLDNKLNTFFKDYYSSDSLERREARTSIRSVHFGKKAYPEIKKALQGLSRKDKDYYDVKTAFIAELGYCRDTAVRDKATETLHDIYNATADTALFQNAALDALSMLEYGKATALFRDLLLQDPPAFEDQFAYYDLFRVYRDSLKLATELYPELLNLTMIEEYKQPVRSLLVDLLDSNYIRPDLYESYVGNIYFDAKLAFKKLQSSNDRNVLSEDETENESSNSRYFPGIDTTNNDLYYHEALLMPFYDKNQNLPVFFNKLLQSNNRLVKLNTALLMLRYNQPVADSIWRTLATDDQYRAYLYSRLQRIGKLALFPARYKSQELLSSSMMNAYMGNRLDSLSLLQQKEMYYKGQKRKVYFYKYRTRKNGEWKIAINSLLQNRNKEVVNDGSLFMISEKPLLSDLPVSGQLEQQLKRLIISNQESGRAFYSRDSNN